MAKIDSILAVDIGGSSLKIGELSYPDGGKVVLEQFAYAEYDQELIDSEGLKEAFSVVYHRLLEEKRFSSKHVRLSLSGQSAFIRLAKLPPMGDKESQVHHIVEYEARQTVPFPMNEVIWDYQLLQHDAVVSKKKVKDGDEDEDEEIEEVEEVEEVTESGDMEAIFVVIKSDLVEELAEIIEASGKEIISIEVAPTACFNAGRASGIGLNDSEMILNIGGCCSTLIFSDSGRIFVRTIPIAGNAVTQQIAKEFKIPFPDAEELKRRHGFVALGGAYEEPDSEVAATVSKIVRNVMTRLHGEINRSVNVYRSQHEGKKPNKMYVSGGSSIMEFTLRFFNEKLRIPVEYFNAFSTTKIADTVDKVELTDIAHMFIEVIGLGLRHASECPIEISLFPDSIKKTRELNAKKPYFYAACVSLLLCLGITLWGVERRLGYDEQRVKVASVEVKRTTKMVNDVKRAMGKLNRQKSEYDSALEILDMRGRWLKVMEALQKVIPDRIWLTSISGMTEEESQGAAKKATAGRKTQGPDIDPTDMFGDEGGMGGARTTKAAISKRTIAWLKLEGHSMVMNDDELLVEQLRKRLESSPVFTDDEDNIIDEEFKGYKGQGKDNIRFFSLRVQLKEPIEQ
jgi:type IV pilus assembly protein PilM